MSKKLTPDEITERLIKYDPNNDNPPEEEVKLEVVETIGVNQKRFEQQLSASQLLKTFLEENNIVLTVSPVSENMKSVSDGSIILSAPKILVNYKN